MVFYGFRSTKPKKIRDQKSCHVPPRAFDDTGVAASTNTCSHAPPVILTRLHALGLNTRALYDVIDDVFMTSLPTTVWPICPGWPGLTHSSWPGANHLQKKIK